MRNKITLALASFFLCSSSWAQLVVVVHPDSPLVASDTHGLAKVFMGKTDEIHGHTVTPVDQADGRRARDTFYEKVANKNASQMQSYWAREIFAGNSQPPESVDDDTAVKAWISKHPNGIGYIDKQHVDAAVKIIYTVD
jgi:ABC-type phosphate transport system substrate-binding protein